MMHPLQDKAAMEMVQKAKKKTRVKLMKNLLPSWTLPLVTKATRAMMMTDAKAPLRVRMSLAVRRSMGILFVVRLNRTPGQKPPMSQKVRSMGRVEKWGRVKRKEERQKA